jgi:tight adherence protein B
MLKIFCKEKPIDKLKYFDDNYEDNSKTEEQKKEKLSILKTLSDFIPKLKGKSARKMEDQLVKADIPLTVEELFVIKIMFSGIFALFAFSILKSLILTAVIFIIIWFIPGLLISERKKKRIKQFDGQLAEGIMIISNSLKAGYSFLQAVSVVTEEIKDPFAKEFKMLLKEMTLGVTEETALNNLLYRMESEDLRLVVNAILIQKDIGGNLSEILDNIEETINERQKIKNEVRTLTAQGRLSGVIITFIPVFLGIIIYFLNKDYIMVLFTNPIGKIMVVSSVINEIIGLLIIRKIINIDI